MLIELLLRKSIMSFARHIRCCHSESHAGLRTFFLLLWWFFLFVLVNFVFAVFFSPSRFRSLSLVSICIHMIIHILFHARLFDNSSRLRYADWRKIERESLRVHLFIYARFKTCERFADSRFRLSIVFFLTFFFFLPRILAYCSLAGSTTHSWIYLCRYSYFTNYTRKRFDEIALSERLTNTSSDC